MKLELRAKLAQNELGRRRNELDREIEWAETILAEVRETAERRDDYIIDTNVADRLVGAAGRISDKVGRVRAALTLVAALEQIAEEQA